MKRWISVIALFASVLAGAQNTQTAAAEAAAALSAADDVPEKVVKPCFWTNTVVTNISFGQTFLSQWAAGGYNNASLSGKVDASANYAKGKLIGTNHLQLDYGFLYSADKPILQKNKDRIYFESKWSYETPVKHLAYSASLDFRTQFDKNWDYKTPTANGTDEPSVQDWLDARVLKSGFFAPAYLNVGIGALWTPWPWFSLNIAPISGGGVFVTIPELRKTYGMDLVSGSTTEYSNHRLEFGLQMKADASWVINDVFSYSTQATLFYNYLTPKVSPRITWDNKVNWQIAKYFAIHLDTYMIYDPLVMVRSSQKNGTVDAPGIQFKEYFELGFTYTITNKKK